MSVSSRAVYVVDPGTGGRREVAGGLSNFQSGYATWLPGHRDVAYGQGGIVRLDVRTGRSEALASGRNLSMPAFSPDGRLLAYGDGVSLWLSGLARPHPHRLPIPAILAPLEMAWSSTGLIAFQGLSLDCSQLVRCVSTGLSEIWTILPDGTGLTELTRLGHAEKPKWSPDGLRILLVRRYPGTTKPAELWVVDSDGSAPHRMLGGGVIAADWSPDGSGLAVVRTGPKPKTLQLYVGRSDGQGLRPMGGPFTGTDATVDW
jgi:Tol biopolymer transport system component